MVNISARIMAAGCTAQVLKTASKLVDPREWLQHEAIFATVKLNVLRPHLGES